jgi:hypothetical protein
MERHLTLTSAKAPSEKNGRFIGQSESAQVGEKKFAEKCDQWNINRSTTGFVVTHRMGLLKAASREIECRGTETLVRETASFVSSLYSHTLRTQVYPIESTD